LFFKLPQSFEQIYLNKVKVVMEENLSRIRIFETMNNKCCEAISSGPWKKTGIFKKKFARHKCLLKQVNNRGTQTIFGICANGDNGICCMKDTSLETMHFLKWI
jgi:hypothetical protein